MTQVFANVRWLPWLLLMMVYSCFYFMIDTLVVTRALNWFIKPIRYRDILPIRASAYIISLFSEQIGKGAMAYYLNRRDQVPGWEVASVMLFIMFCEVFYLLTWATVGFIVSRSSLPAVFGLMPFISLGAGVVFALWVLYFRGTIFPASRLRDKKILHAFRMATLKHYVLFFLLRSPALLAAVLVYTIALNLFGVQASLLAAARVPADHLLRGDGAHAHASGRHYALGRPVPRERRPDGRLRIRAAQLLHPVQCADWRRVLARGLNVSCSIGKWPMPSPPSDWRWSCPCRRFCPARASRSERRRAPSLRGDRHRLLDGRVARMTGTASARGQLFDHGTDCLFVTGGLRAQP